MRSEPFRFIVVTTDHIRVRIRNDHGLIRVPRTKVIKSKWRKEDSLRCGSRGTIKWKPGGLAGGAVVEPRQSRDFGGPSTVLPTQTRSGVMADLEKGKITERLLQVVSENGLRHTP
jgi:hypothetical protein